MELGARHGTWAIEINRGLASKAEKGFHIALDDIRPDQAFLVYSGTDRYPKGNGIRTVEQIRQRCVCEGLPAALERCQRSRVLDGEGEARLVSIACSESRRRDMPGDLTVVGGSLGGIEGGGIDIPRDRASSVKKNAIEPWQKRMWCIPAPAKAAFVCQMEAVIVTPGTGRFWHSLSEWCGRGW